MSRSSVTKQNAFQAAPEVIPILDGSCARLKRLLRLCDQQIDSIEQDSGMSSPAKGKELQILVRLVLTLQKDLLKYTQTLHPDIPVKAPVQTGGKFRKEDLEALSDSQLHELMTYFTRDNEDTEVDIQGIVDSMLNRQSSPRDSEAKEAPAPITIPNTPVSNNKESPTRFKVQSKNHETRQPATQHPAQGKSRHGSPPDRSTGKSDNPPKNQQQRPHGSKQTENQKQNKAPPGPPRDPNTE